MTGTDDAWAQVVANLDRGVSSGLNMAHECCERWAGDRGRLALVIVGPDGSRETWTYFELARQAARAAGAFDASGLRRGDKVAAILTRQVEAWVAALAAWRSGLVYVPLFAGFGEEALAQRLNAAGADAVVVDSRWRDTLQRARDLLDKDVEVFTVAGPRGDGIIRGDRSFWAEVNHHSPDRPLVETPADETAILMFTSGTTSVPKGCVIPHDGFLAVMPWFEHSLALGPADVLFTTTDPGWSFGLLSTGAVAMARGLTRVMYTGDFDPAAWFRVIESEQVTHIAGVPTAFRRLVAHARRHGAPTCLTGATSAGEPLDEDTVAGWTELTGTPIRDGYGQTELGMVLANLAVPETPIVAGALASIVPGWEVRLIDEHGTTIEGPGQGEIAVRRPPFQLTRSYVNAAEVWQARWVDDEWFRTGDVARRDELERYWFVGRDDDVIVTAGYNVGPAEVESVLLLHPCVAEAAVVAAPDPDRGGSAVRAVLVLRPDEVPSAALTAELQEAVRSGIGRHAYPRLVEYVDALPRTETGKIRRAVIRSSAPTG